MKEINFTIQVTYAGITHEFSNILFDFDNDDSVEEMEAEAINDFLCCVEVLPCIVSEKRRP